MSYGERKARLKITSQPREEWWSRAFATPMAHLILTVVADWRLITPNRLTILSFGLTITTGICILASHPTSLIVAGLLLQVAYIIDCMDGQLARYRGLSTQLGSLLDKWSDFVKFPFVVVALTLQALDHHPGATPIILGFSSLFLICYQPYLKLIASSECSVRPWNVLSGKGRLQRNLRFVLFEEAQWYLIVSVCLLLQQSLTALILLSLTQGVMALLQTCRVFWSVIRADDRDAQ
jgi:phosphatidylglycerophosphate synthase